MFRSLCLALSLLISSSVFASTTHYIMDTDMGFDDWLAVLYILKQPVIIDAVTIDCAGETFCPQGAINAEKLNFLAKRHVPIAYGKSLSSHTYDFPMLIRSYASEMNVPDFAHLKQYHDLIHTDAATLIYTDILTAAKAHDKVVFISIGTAKNIDDAWKLAVKNHTTDAFRQGLGMIYKGGGAFGDIKNHQISNKNIAGNISIPGMVESQNTAAEWNIYADAPAMKDLIEANLPITFIPNNASDQVNMTKNAYDRIAADEKTNPIKKFTANAMMTLVIKQGGWAMVHGNLDFWDTAATLAALYPDIISTTFQRVPVTLSVTPGNTYGGIFITENSTHFVDVAYHLNKQQFYEKLDKNL